MFSKDKCTKKLATKYICLLNILKISKYTLHKSNMFYLNTTNIKLHTHYKDEIMQIEGTKHESSQHLHPDFISLPRNYSQEFYM